MPDTKKWVEESTEFWRRLSIRQGLVGSVVFILLLFGTACAVSFIAFENVRSARVLSGDVTSALMRTAELEEAVTRSQSALRAYALSGDARFVDTIDRMTGQYQTALEALYEYSAQSAKQRHRLDEIKRLQREWQSSVILPVIEEVKEGNLQQARGDLTGGAGTNLTDPLRKTLDQFRFQVQNELDRSVALINYRQDRARWVLLGVLLFGLLTGLFTVRAVVRRVTRPLGALARMTTRLAQGERDLHVYFRERNDEIGQVANALEKFRQIILEQDRQAWIRDHRARLTVALQKCKTEQEVGKRLLEEIAPLFGVGYAALFTPVAGADNEDTFALVASYGYCRDVAQTFEVGEGLVGQVLANGKQIVMNDVPANYLTVRSGLGEVVPKVLMIAPAKAAGSILGVLELGMLHEPSEAQQGLLDTLLPSVGLGLLSLARTRRAVELLEQSRAQTEALKESEQRLRDRQEELKNANSELRMQSEELNAQSEELRASEEELKVQSDELQATNEELRQRQELMRKQQKELARLHAETKRRAEALAQTSQYKSDFLANMSHELRTPLNSLLILSRSLADNTSGHLDEEESEAAAIIHESGTGLLSLINDILDLSKIEAGKMVVTPERTPVDGIVRRIERDFAHVAQRKGIAFEVYVGVGVPDTLVTDPGKLDQVIRNLVSNAIKFTEQGTVRVEIAAPAADTVFRTKDLVAEEALAIHIIDDGIGIPKNRLEQIFQAFEQVDAGTSRTYGGTGLGLSISRELARLLGGEISVESELGEGSRFSIYVRRVLDTDIEISPTVSDKAQTRRIDEGSTLRAQRPSEVDRQDSSGRAHVLIIDDDMDFARIVAKAAEERGFDCSTASNGDRGLDMVRQQLPDAIVLDLGLPGMDGWAVLDRLKANERTRNIPVHIVSAADDNGRSKQAGAVGYLSKPVSKEDLETLFARAEVLSGRQARRVLVVDDDRGAHTAINHLLQTESVDITAVVSGAEAIQRLDAEGFDCVVLDLSLPDISGFDLLEQIAERDDAPPVVVYSARELSEEETRRLRAHTDSIVIKGSRAQERLLDEVSLFFHQLSERSDTAAAKAVDSETAARMVVAPNLAGQTALLVDDDMRNTFALSRALREKGLKVLMASDGFKALDQLAANPQVTIVLMDIMMPGMDGYETIRRIRAQSEYETLPIIALTAKAMTGDREKCIEAGATEYLPKPLDIQALLKLMARLL
ncbi:two-component system chemotaxis family sensor kinase CheA protein [Salinisphaera shabanensis E1L3A]|uniref:histidine kinase n=1 Tax=Salinisphaera shabanensis E1L3A TaxID=1033802 RepID=U2FXE7_9GAMM|nr:response regulator [Salinisphaera shabanensis]ERJ18893.1 two-component system chemotaxis family sensor kinase CheA protein [Salinisphaera shabanensis E1L3A]